MGIGTITGGGPQGLYSITVDTGSLRRDAQIAELESRVASLESDITIATAAYEADLDLEQDEKAAFESSIDAYVIALSSGGDGSAELDAMNKATENYGKVRAATLASERALNNLKLALSAAQKELTKKRAISTDLQLSSVWCADLTEDAAGIVGTIEIPGEPQATLIVPQYNASNAADGFVTTRYVMTGPQAYFNAAVLPGWQKWMPTYRGGVATAIDYGARTMDVALYQAMSSAQNLLVNQAEALIDVPVTYMTCDTDAFVVGDDVVVKFDSMDWASPRVIGFLHDPKGCGCTEGLELYEDFEGNYGDLGRADPYVFRPVTNGTLGWQWAGWFVFGDPYSGRWRNPWNEGGLVTDCKVMMGSYHYMSQDNRYDYDTVNEWIVKGCLKSQGARWNRWETNINFLGGQIGYPTGNVPYPAIVVVETRSGIVGEGDILAAIFDIGFSLNESVGSHCFLHTTHYAIATPAQGWHVLRVDLTAYYIRWYIDGVQVAEHIGGYEFACALTFNWVPSVGGGMPLLSYPDTRSDAELDYVYYRQV